MKESVIKLANNLNNRQYRYETSMILEIFEKDYSVTPIKQLNDLELSY